MILELEQLIHNKLKQIIGHSGMVVRLAELQPQDGRVFTDSYISVKFKGAENQNGYESHGQNTVRSRILYFDIITEIKNSVRNGHSFALPYLDKIWFGLTGWMPRFPTQDFFFQTGLEPYSETYVETDEASVFKYSQSFKIQVLLNHKATAGSQGEDYCGLFNPDICLEDFLPTRRCLKDTNTGRNIGVAFWSAGRDGTEAGYVVDLENCPLSNRYKDCLTTSVDYAEGEPVTFIYNNRYAYDLSPSWVGNKPHWGANFNIKTNLTLVGQSCNRATEVSYVFPLTDSSED